MSTFWLIYWIAFGIIVVFSLFTFVFLDMKVNYNKFEPVPLAYAIFALLVGLVPGVGILGSVILIGTIIAAMAEGDLKPKKHPFSNDENE